MTCPHAEIVSGGAKAGGAKAEADLCKGTGPGRSMGS
jgi:hypothetical protein